MRVVDLFSGCGGLSQGFVLADYNVVAAFDCWAEAVKIYKKNFEHYVEMRDLTDFESSVRVISEWAPDCIIGGPPCQDFSHAGSRKEGERASLTVLFADIVCQVKPVWFVMENVDRAAKSSAYQQARAAFKKYGYGLTEVVLDASFYGVPQKRKRFFSIACLHEKDGFLSSFLDSLKSKKPMTVRDYLGDALGIEHYYRHPCNYNRRAIFSIDEPAPTIRGVNRPIGPGYPGHPGDSSPLTKQIRALTTQERALLQTFPDDFVFDGTKTTLEQMIGNAVPVNLAKFVANAITDYIFCNKETDMNGNFKEWLIDNKKFKAKSASDVVSRLRRVSRIINLRLEISQKDLIEMLEKSSEFSELSQYVRPQLKRALLLFLEYKKSAIH